MAHYKNSILVEFIKNYGINKSLAVKMCKKIRVSPLKNADSIILLKKRRAFSFLKSMKIPIDFELKDKKLQKFVHLYSIKHLKSLKHKFFLPITGQRNCTNGSALQLL
jgi:ribosomal protein S13